MVCFSYMNRRRFWIVLSSAFSVLITPLTTFAASSGLVPCGVVPPGVVGKTYLIATECNLCDFGTLTQNIINYILLISIPLSVMLFAWAGILYFSSAENPGQIAKAHKIFTSVLIGFVIIVSAWLVVQTLLMVLIDRSFWGNGASWNSLGCADKDHNPANANPDTAESPSNTRPRDTSVGDLLKGIFRPSSVVSVPTPTTQTGPIIPVDPAPVGETDARNRLVTESEGAISFNKTCSDGQSNCPTQLAKVAPDVLAGVVAVQKDCAYLNGGICPLVVTAGSEPHPGYATDPHAAGNAVDLRVSPAVDAQMRAYIGLTANPVPSTSGDGYTARINGQNFRIYYEGDHWHLEARR